MSDPRSVTSLPPVDFEALEDDLSQRCPYCRTKLVPLIETRLGLVWGCPNSSARNPRSPLASQAPHAWTPIFWGGEHGEEGPRNMKWIIEALMERAVA